MILLAVMPRRRREGASRSASEATREEPSSIGRSRESSAGPARGVLNMTADRVFLPCGSIAASCLDACLHSRFHSPFARCEGPL